MKVLYDAEGMGYLQIGTAPEFEQKARSKINLISYACAQRGTMPEYVAEAILYEIEELLEFIPNEAQYELILKQTKDATNR